MNTLWKSVAVIKNEGLHDVGNGKGKEWKGMRRNASTEGFVKESIPIVGLILILQQSAHQSQDLSQFLPQPEDFLGGCIPITGFTADVPLLRT